MCIYGDFRMILFMKNKNGRVDNEENEYNSLVFVCSLFRFGVSLENIYFFQSVINQCEKCDLMRKSIIHQTLNCLWKFPRALSKYLRRSTRHLSYQPLSNRTLKVVLRKILKALRASPKKKLFVEFYLQTQLRKKKLGFYEDYEPVVRRHVSR